MEKTISLSNQQFINAFNGYNYVARKEVNGKLVFALASLGATLRRHAQTLEKAQLVISKDTVLTDEEKAEAARVLMEEASHSIAFKPISKAELVKYDFAPGAIEALLPFLDGE